MKIERCGIEKSAVTEEFFMDAKLTQPPIYYIRKTYATNAEEKEIQWIRRGLSDGDEVLGFLQTTELEQQYQQLTKEV